MTKTKTIAIADATYPELVAYATLTLGLEVKPNTPLPALRAKIAGAMPGTDIIVIPAADDDAGAADAPMLDAGPGAAPLAVAATRLELIKEKAGTVSASGRYDPLVTVMVYEGQEEGGKRPVPVGVNGTIILVPRGKPVQLPYRYWEALKNAERITYTEADGELLEHKMAAYPFQTIQPADPAELAAWMDATADRFAA